jgi:hypothetical protein
MEKRHGATALMHSLVALSTQAIERQLAAFREKFRRDPNDDDPIFFDSDAGDLVPLSDEKYERMMIDGGRYQSSDNLRFQAYRRDCDREEQGDVILTSPQGGVTSLPR